MPLSIVESRHKDIPSYDDFFNLFVANVVGKKHFENVCWRKKLSNFVTVSDKAIALLVYENNYERWTDMGKKANYNFSTVQPKYTSGGNACQTPKAGKLSSLSKKGKKGVGKTQTDEKACSYNKNDSTCARYQGWSMEGIRKYNFFFDAVKEECASCLGAEFEDAFLQYSKNQKDNTAKKHKKEAIAFEVCRHELWEAGCNTSFNLFPNQKSEVPIDDYVLFDAEDGLSRSPSFVISDNNIACNQAEV